MPLKLFVVLDGVVGFDRAFVMEKMGEWKEVAGAMGGQMSLKDYSGGKKKEKE